MKTKLLISILLLLLVSCDKDDNTNPDSRPNSISYEFSFSTEQRPFSISFNKESHTLYIANNYPSIHDYSSKIQAFNIDGTFIKTVVDFETFELGSFERYEPLDFTFDNHQNIFVLVKPLIKQTDGYWTTPTGFSILQFADDGRFMKELDFSYIEGEMTPSSISYYKNQLFVTKGHILKQINLNSLQIDNVTLPIDNDNDSSTWPYLHTTDMEINSDGLFLFTGQAKFSKDSLGCHLSNYNIDTKELTVNYAKGWTRECCAGFNNPGLFISNDGYLYLASFYKMSIEVYDKNYNFIIDCDTRTSQFKETRPIDVVYENGKIFVADYFNNQIHIYKQE